MDHLCLSMQFRGDSTSRSVVWNMDWVAARERSSELKGDGHESISEPSD